jgi:ribosomal protein S12 methylthiotransferase
MKIGFLSLGCPKNLVDGEVMLGMAREAGHEITTEAANAEVLVVNTCAFIDSAKQESIDAILEMAAQKRDGRCSRLVVTGCLAERYRDELRREIPEIDAVLGTGEVPQILEAIGVSGLDFQSQGSGIRDQGYGIANQGSGIGDQGYGIAPAAVPLTFFGKSPGRLGRGNAPVDARAPGSLIPDPRIIDAAPRVPDYLYDADTPRYLTTPRHFAYVKVAEGCDYTCAFCIIPTLRGSYRSRTAESIVREARALAERGVRELLLISQDTTFFGIDRGERGALGRLLRELNTIDGLTWIRLLYLYPTTITDDVLAAMADCEKVCRYIDLPLQHASADVLKRMRRPGNRRTYDKLLARIRSTVPEVTLRTTLIVGFPGETEDDFAELEGFVADTGFDHVGVFTYSHEEGTRAFGLPDDVPAAVKRRRRNALMTRQKKIVARAHRARIGTEAAVLIDGPSAEHEMVLQGRLEGQAPDIDSVVYLTDCDSTAFVTGALIQTRVVGARGYDLVAAPLE